MKMITKAIVEKSWINLYDSVKPLDKPLCEMNESQRNCFKVKNDAYLKEKIRIWNKKYYEKNKEKICAKEREKYAQNKQKRRGNK